jgi:hypothetical protein
MLLYLSSFMKGHNGRISPVSVDSEGVCIQIGSPLGSMIVVTEPSSALKGRIARLHEACHFHPTPSATLTNYLLKLSLLDRADLAFTSDSDQVPDVVEEYFKEGNNGTFVVAQGLKHCGLGDLNCITNLHAGDQFVGHFLQQVLSKVDAGAKWKSLDRCAVAMFSHQAR